MLFYFQMFVVVILTEQIKTLVFINVGLRHMNTWSRSDEAHAQYMV